jgi:mono/diheme cytochrome c family protein
MRRLIALVVVAAALVAAALFALTAPERARPEDVAGLTGDPDRGARVFAIGGCASCHSAPETKGAAKLVLSGGRRFPSPFGTFVAPNISPSEAGIGGWTALDLLTALRYGVSPEGAHYYPAFPYTSYALLTAEDAVDLKAYLDTLPPSDVASGAHDILFPFNIRRGLGLWKRLYLRHPSAEGMSRGRYLVEGPGHCAECHTPRGVFGGLDRDRMFSGAPKTAPGGGAPNITPDKTGIGDWSEADIAEYLASGFRPDYDVAGGEMASVIEQTAKLPPEDRAAIAAYLKTLPPLPSSR